MKLSILATVLSAVTALPVNIAAGDVDAADKSLSMTPLVYVTDNGDLYVSENSQKNLMSVLESQYVMSAAAAANPSAEQPAQIGSLQRRAAKLARRNILCCDDDCCDDCCDPCNDCCDPCDPCCDDDNCEECAEALGLPELRNGCYSKWLCPKTYCRGGHDVGPEDECNQPRGPHPILDGLRSYCPTKWLCPKTYCPSNWFGCGNDGCCGSDNCCDPCDDCCDPCDDCCDPCDDCCDPCCSKRRSPRRRHRYDACYDDCYDDGCCCCDGCCSPCCGHGLLCCH